MHAPKRMHPRVRTLAPPTAPSPPDFFRPFLFTTSVQPSASAVRAAASFSSSSAAARRSAASAAASYRRLSAANPGRAAACAASHARMPLATSKPSSAATSDMPPTHPPAHNAPSPPGEGWGPAPGPARALWRPPAQPPMPTRCSRMPFDLYHQNARDLAEPTESEEPSFHPRGLKRCGPTVANLCIFESACPGRLPQKDGRSAFRNGNLPCAVAPHMRVPQHVKTRVYRPCKFQP